MVRTPRVGFSRSLARSREGDRPWFRASATLKGRLVNGSGSGRARAMPPSESDGRRLHTRAPQLWELPRSPAHGGGAECVAELAPSRARARPFCDMSVGWVA
nr:hypothetical protein GCM10025699_22020 [Microbacterium flavescens]